jgi:hypothetical protein
MIVIKYSHVLSSLRPNSEWKMQNEDYSTLEWYSSDEKPTQEFLDSEIDKMIIQQKILLCKSKAQSFLNESDFADLYSVRNKLENINEWDTYRAIIRELRINPIENPVFPDKPQTLWKES